MGQVYLGDLWVNGALVRGGFAYVYPEYAIGERLYEFEREAKESKAGMWEVTRERKSEALGVEKAKEKELI